MKTNRMRNIHLHVQKEYDKYSMWALNRIKIKNIVHTKLVNNNRGTNQPTSSTQNFYSQRPHIVVPYTKDLSNTFKNVCSKHRIQVYCRGGRTIKDLTVVSLKTKTLRPKQVGSHIYTQVKGWNVMKSILESSQEHFWRGSRNI